MFYYHLKKSESCRKNFASWKLFQILFILQNCLILQVACRFANEHGLLRGSVNGIFVPVNSTVSVPNGGGYARGIGEADILLQSQGVSDDLGDISTSPTNPTTTTDNEEDESLKQERVSPSDPEEEEDDYDEDTNKPKRSKGQFRRLLQKLGLGSTPTKPSEREEELEAQMAEDDSVDADSSGGSETMTTAKPGSSILSKLNPINKISYKINTARNVVNRALNVVGLGSKPATTEGSDMAEGGGQDEGGSTKGAAPSAGDEDSGSRQVSQERHYIGVIITVGVILGSVLL